MREFGLRRTSRCEHELEVRNHNNFPLAVAIGRNYDWGNRVRAIPADELGVLVTSGTNEILVKNLPCIVKNALVRPAADPSCKCAHHAFSGRSL